MQLELLGEQHQTSFGQSRSQIGSICEGLGGLGPVAWETFSVTERELTVDYLIDYLLLNHPVFVTVLLPDAEQGGSIWGDRQEALLPGSSPNPPAEENHPGLGIVLVPEFSPEWVEDRRDGTLHWLSTRCAYRFAVGFMYYGISFKISGFGVNIYLTQLIYGAIEVPAKIGTFFAVDWIGRRNSQAIFLIATGALIGLNTAIPLGGDRPSSSFVMTFSFLAKPLASLFQNTRLFECAWLWWQRDSLRRRSPRHSFTQPSSSQPSSGTTQHRKTWLYAHKKERGFVQKGDWGFVTFAECLSGRTTNSCVPMQAVWYGIHLWRLSDWRLLGSAPHALGGRVALSSATDLCRHWHCQWLPGFLAPRDSKHMSARTRGGHWGRQVKKHTEAVKFCSLGISPISELNVQILDWRFS